MTTHDLAEHTTSLLAIISALGSIVAILFWRLIGDVRDRVKTLNDLQLEFMKNCFANHSVLVEKFPSREEWAAWQKGREDIKRGQAELWDAFNKHMHNGGGKVVRG